MLQSIHSCRNGRRTDQDIHFTLEKSLETALLFTSEDPDGPPILAELFSYCLDDSFHVMGIDESPRLNLLSQDLQFGLRQYLLQSQYRVPTNGAPSLT